MGYPFHFRWVAEHGAATVSVKISTIGTILTLSALYVPFLLLNQALRRYLESIGPGTDADKQIKTAKQQNRNP